MTPPVRGARIAPNVWSFSSPSSDLRLLDLNMIDPSTINGLEPGGAAIALVAATLGYGSNYLNALRVGNRLILNNGTHRAFALRDMGLTHAPCLIQNTTRREELDLAGVPDLEERADLFLTHPRPPLLKDYFDAKLRMLLNVPRTQRQLRVAVQVEQVDVPAS